MIDPEDNSQQNLPVSKSASACDNGAGLLSSQLECLNVEGDDERGVTGNGGSRQEECGWVSAVFVFGGMDTTGNIHGDSFLLVPQ